MAGNDDEFLVFRSRGPIRTVKFREVYLSVDDCDALRKPRKVSRSHTRLFDRSVEDSGGAPQEKHASVIHPSCEAEIDENMSTRREEDSG